LAAAARVDYIDLHIVRNRRTQNIRQINAP
jgi:hypothetical protein